MNDPIMGQFEKWAENRHITPEMLELARAALEDIRQGSPVFDAIQRHPITAEGGGYIGKQVLVKVYRQLVKSGTWPADPALLARIRMKPVRTQSGVTVVTVLTKPYPCPGKCIFCPDDVRMPKSYLPDEPGAMRAYHNEFDPYRQVTSRLEALDAVGHPTDKIELLVLGGTWDAYRKDYQEWFIQRLFDAMNEQDSQTLLEAQAVNQTANHRNVGLVIETRPDHISPKQLRWLRYLGVTKVQMGAQSLDDRILEMNKRGHDTAATLKAMYLLRAAAFKVVLHWMPNLYGATPQSDREDFSRMWQGYCPDELKIYPNQLLEETELYGIWQQGLYKPYTTQQLIDLLVDIKPTIPRYCRLNRVIRDIPSTHVVEGNKRTSLRMDVQKTMKAHGLRCQCIRCREVRGRQVEEDELHLDDLVYPAGPSTEHFLSFVTADDHLAGFLRLSLPEADAPQLDLGDLTDAALIREVHVYGQALKVGASKDGAAQHIGLGTRLLEEAEKIAAANGYKKLAVISAVGTREYYAGRGFTMGELYMVKLLEK